MLNLFRRGANFRDTVEKLYAALVAQARRPSFYVDLGVPDTAEGRFDMVGLHTFLVLRRLKREPAPGSGLAQALFDHMFADLDHNLREMGVGDLGVARRVKALAEGFYGRIAAYDAGLAGDDQLLEDAFNRNLYRQAQPPAGALAALAAYLRREAAALDTIDFEVLRRGDISFGPAPALSLS